MNTISTLCKASQLTIILWLVSFVAVAQIQTKRIDPQEIQGYLKFQSDKTPPRVTMKPVDVARLLEEDKNEQDSGLPPRFGKALDVDLGLQNAGSWEEFPLGRI